MKNIFAFDPLNNTKFWNEFYAHSNLTDTPSSFAQFCISMIDKNKTLLELGCGNGRDTFFFSQSGIRVIALDLSNEAIRHNSAKENGNVDFYVHDFTNVNAKEINLIDVKSIYSRFTLHSVDKAGFDRTLEWVASTLPIGGRFFMEARTINDTLFGQGEPLPDNGFFTTHYRRFLIASDIKKQFEHLPFNLLYFVEDFINGQMNNDGAVVLRVIAEKK